MASFIDIATATTTMAAMKKFFVNRLKYYPDGLYWGMMKASTAFRLH